MDIIQEATEAYLKGAKVITCGYNQVGGASQVIEMPDGKQVYMDMLALCNLISRLVDRLEWKGKDTMPNPKQEGESFLIDIKHKTDDGHSVAQVSWFEGRLYPDAKEYLIDWEDGIDLSRILGWLPLPPVGDK